MIDDIAETDAQRVARVQETNLVTSTADILAIFRSAKPLSLDEIDALLADARASDNECY